MGQKQLKVTLAVLNAVKSRFIQTNEWKRNEKEKITADEVIFFASKLVKKISLDKHFCLRFGTIVIIFLFIDVERSGR